MNHPQDNAPVAASYVFHCVLQPQTFAQAVAHGTEALKTEGFGILTEIDVQATMRVRSVLVGASAPAPATSLKEHGHVL